MSAGGRKRQWRDRTRVITADNVLLIVNSDVALSATIADYYQAARGLTDHRMAFSFGTASANTTHTPADFYNSVIVPVWAYITANNIKAVLCSAGVPQRVKTLVHATSGLQSNLLISSCLGHGGYIVNVLGRMIDGPAGASQKPLECAQRGSTAFYNPYPPPVNLSVYPPGCWFSCDAYHYESRPGYRWADTLENPRFIPYGRIGLAAIGGAPAETEAETKRMIDDCIANELSYQDTAEGNNLVHIGLHDRAQPWINGRDQELARRRLLRAGVAVKHYRRSYDSGYDIQPPPDSYALADMLAGSLSEPAWCLLGAAIMNEAYGAPYVGSFTFKPGAWGFEATSAGLNLYNNIITNGGAAGLGAAYEPYADGVPKVDALLFNLLQGRTLATANVLSDGHAGWAMEVTGDPLYRPFGKQFCCHH